MKYPFLKILLCCTATVFCSKEDDGKYVSPNIIPDHSATVTQNPLPPQSLDANGENKAPRLEVVPESIMAEYQGHDYISVSFNLQLYSDCPLKSEDLELILDSGNYTLRNNRMDLKCPPKSVPQILSVKGQVERSLDSHYVIVTGSANAANGFDISEYLPLILSQSRGGYCQESCVLTDDVLTQNGQVYRKYLSFEGDAESVTIAKLGTLDEKVFDRFKTLIEEYQETGLTESQLTEYCVDQFVVTTKIFKGNESIPVQRKNENCFTQTAEGEAIGKALDFFDGLKRAMNHRI